MHEAYPHPDLERASRRESPAGQRLSRNGPTTEAPLVNYGLTVENPNSKDHPQARRSGRQRRAFGMSFTDDLW
jgi:hypothetical protein